MTATYNYDPTEADTISLVRGLIGDTSVGVGGLQGSASFADQTITARYAANGTSPALAAASLLRTWANQLITQPKSQKFGDWAETLADPKAMLDLAERYEAAAGAGGTWSRVEGKDYSLPRVPLGGWR